MELRIAATFTDSLAKLTGDEQKAAKSTAFDLQMHPSAPGLSFHRVDRARDRNFWSVRVNWDVHLIVHRTSSSVMLGPFSGYASNQSIPFIEQDCPKVN